MEEGKYGVWIDGKKAVIVNNELGKEGVVEVASDIDYNPREEGEGKKYTRMGKQFISHEKSEENSRQMELASFLNKVSSSMGAATKVVLYGPGKIKDELKKVIVSSNTNVSVETLPSDHLTTNQIVALVAQYFSI